MKITVDMIADVLLGDDSLVELFPPAQRMALLRTRERLRGVGGEVAHRMATEGPVSTAEIERLLIIVLEEVMMELDVPRLSN